MFPPQYPEDSWANDLRTYAQYDWQMRQVELRFVHYGGQAGRIVTVAEPLKLVPVKEADYQGPTVRLSNDAAQSLMDQLWQCGIRPTEGTGSAGSLAATEKHLADMRCIAFASLKIPDPPKKK